MIEITQAIYNRLAGDQELVDMLATYQGEDSAAIPCIFTDELIPENASLPYIWSSGQISDTPDDNKVQEGRTIMRDIHFYVERTGDSTLLEAMAERGRRLFHRHQIPMEGARVIVSSVTGPIRAFTEEPTVVGRIITVTMRIENDPESS